MFYLELEEVRMWNGCENTGCHVGTLSLSMYFYSEPKQFEPSCIFLQGT